MSPSGGEVCGGIGSGMLLLQPTRNDPAFALFGAAAPPAAGAVVGDGGVLLVAQGMMSTGDASGHR